MKVTKRRRRRGIVCMYDGGSIYKKVQQQAENNWEKQTQFIWKVRYTEWDLHLYTHNSHK